MVLRLLAISNLWLRASKIGTRGENLSNIGQCWTYQNLPSSRALNVEIVLLMALFAVPTLLLGPASRGTLPFGVYELGADEAESNQSMRPQI
jgi:hypothetical protein